MTTSVDYYFAELEADEIGDEIVQKVQEFDVSMSASDLSDRIRRSYRFHYGYTVNGNSSMEIGTGGEQGELSVSKVNHYANFVSNLKGLITANRPALIPIATNTDMKSLAQTVLASGILDYYVRDKKIERFWSQAVEYALICGASWLKINWNFSSGEEIGLRQIERPLLNELGEPTGEYESRQELEMTGDLEFSVHSPFDVMFDINKRDSDFDWVIVRSFKNRHNLAAKYKPFRKEIYGITTEDVSVLNRLKFQTDLTSMQNAVMSKEEIPVYEFYHKASDILPEGRYTIVLPDGTVLQDGALPIKKLPVLRISAQDLLETPHGWTVMFNLLTLQEQLDVLNSIIFNNQELFGGISVAAPKASDFNIQELGKGSNIFHYNAVNTSPDAIKALQLLNTSAELFQNRQKIEQDMETLSGVNSVVRGQPTPAAGASGASQALTYAQALQFVSGFQQNYNALLEDTGTVMFQFLKTYASHSRKIATIAGKSQRYLIKEFTKDDISEINRVTVEVSNPIAKTTAGKLQIAQDLLSQGFIKTPDQYLQVLTTGKLEPIFEAQQTELMNIRSENELLADGEMPSVFALDNHKLHIQEHRSVIDNPEARKDPAVIKAVWDHIQEHMFTWRNTDPELLLQSGIQPPMTKAPAIPAPSGQGLAPQALDLNGPLEAQLPNQPNLPNNPATGEPVALANPNTELPPGL